MIYKYYHFVFETTYITVCWLLIFTCQGELWWSSVLHIPLYVDCWPLPGRRILTIFIDISSPGRVISHLNVSSVHSSDGGLYRCQAQNSVSFFNILDIVGDNMYLYLRWVWSLTPQGWMCMVHHHRVVCRMSPLSRGFRIFYQHPRDALLEAPNISDDKKLREKALFSSQTLLQNPNISSHKKLFPLVLV